MEVEGREREVLAAEPVVQGGAGKVQEGRRRPNFPETGTLGARGGGKSKPIRGLRHGFHFGADPETGTAGGVERSSERALIQSGDEPAAETRSSILPPA